jgi:hypothetical protein
MTQPQGPRWRALLAPFDTVTGDGRVLARPTGEVRTRPLPQPLLYQGALADGHDGAVLVGAIDKVWTDSRGMWGAGPWDTAGQVSPEVMRQVVEGYLRGISVDLDNITAELACVDGAGKVGPCPAEALDGEGEGGTGLRVVEVMTDYRLMGATVVSQAAFAEAYIEMDDDGGGEVAPAAPAAPASAAAAAGGGAAPFEVTGDTGLPIADRERTWDAAAAAGRVAEWATVDGEVDPAKYSQAFLWRDPDGDPTAVGSYKLGFADIADGTLTVIPKGVFAVAAALQGARGGVDIPEADAERVKGKVDTLYGRMADQFDDPALVPPWQGGAADGAAPSSAPAGAEAVARAAVLVAAAAAPRDLPRAAFFEDPQLAGPIPLVVDGRRVYGHLAAWRDHSGALACHVGYPGTCVEVPHSATGYAYFHTGHVVTDGGLVAVGTITLGATHAGEHASWAQATTHYADSGQGVAVGRAGEDAHGIWFAGVLTEGASDVQVAALLRCTISPDWRRVAGSMEMVGALAVNSGGFPMPRSSAVGREQVSLVAAGALHRPAPAERQIDVEMREAVRAYTRAPDIAAFVAAVRAYNEGQEAAAQAALADRARRMAQLAASVRVRRARQLAAHVNQLRGQ